MKSKPIYHIEPGFTLYIGYSLYGVSKDWDKSVYEPTENGHLIRTSNMEDFDQQTGKVETANSIYYLRGKGKVYHCSPGIPAQDVEYPLDNTFPTN